jgi:hypothetical protein
LSQTSVVISMADYDKRKLTIADLRQMDDVALSPAREPPKEAGIEEGDWFDYLPPSPVKLIKSAMSKMAGKMAGKETAKKVMTEAEKLADKKAFAAKLEGLKEKMSPEQRQEIIKEVQETSYGDVYRRLTAVPEKEKVAKSLKEITLNYGQVPKKSASITEGKTFDTLTPSPGVKIKQ